MVERLNTVAIQGGQLALNCGQDEVPEIIVALELVLSNHPESVGDLEIGHLLAVLLEHEHEGIGGLGTAQGEVNLMEDETPVVIEVVVPSSMDRADRHLSELNRCSESVRSQKSALAQSGKEVSTSV